MENQQHLSDLQHEEEYFNRVKWFVTDFKHGRYIVEVKSGFHAHFKGTEADYDKVTEIYYKNHDYGKIIGVHTFNTYEEYRKRYPLKNVK